MGRYADEVRKRQEVFTNQEEISQSRWWKKFRQLEEENLLPLTGDWVLVEKIKPTEFKTKGGLFIGSVDTHRETTIDRSTKLGLVLATGPGNYLEDGSMIPMGVQTGDVVVLPHTTDWFDIFFGVHLGEDQIGRVRAAQIPMGTGHLKRIQSVLHGE